MSDLKAFRATVAGLVQGVGFRYWAAREAHRLGVVGWVRNAPSGGVEVLAQGGAEVLDAFGGWLADGPSHARVVSLDVEPELPDPTLTTFEIRH